MSDIIYNDIELIGSIENIEKFFKEEMKREINDNLSFEEMKYNFNDIFDIILTIQEKEQENINNNCLFKIIECPMGGFIYSVLKEIKEV